MNDSVKTSKPGLLMSNAKIRLQTIPAQKLLFGNKNGAIGLFQFVAYIFKIWKAASFDDPYADQYLLKVYESMMLARRKIKSLQQKYSKILEQANLQENGLEKNAMDTNVPKIYPLKSINKYVILGARLIIEFDELMRILMTCCTYSILETKESKKTAENVKYTIRQSFGIAQQWQHTGVTRKDVRHKNQVAARAHTKMGKLNNDVLTGTLRSPYAPAVKHKKT